MYFEKALGYTGSIDIKLWSFLCVGIWLENIVNQNKNKLSILILKQVRK